MPDRRVLFFGDSFVAGAGDPTAAGWVGRVAAAGWAAGLEVSASNLGIGGETSVQVAARWRAEAAPRTTQDADHRVVFSFGANDATEEEKRVRVPLETSAAVLDRVLAEAAELGLPAFVVGPPPVCDPAQDERIAALAGAFAAVCRERRVLFADVTAGLLEEGTWCAEAARGDGSHPAGGGYAALADLVVGAGFLEWLARPVGAAQP